MSENVQPGVRIDSDVWERFREDVKARKGAVRGHLQTELENAIRQYLKHEPRPVEKRIEEKLTRIESAVGAASADGGVDVSSPATHAHTPSEKPDPRAPTGEKVDWLIQQIVDEYAKEGQDPDTVAINRDNLEKVITDAYDFGDRTLPKYKERIIERLDLWPHPDNDFILFGPTEYEKIADDTEESEA